MTQTARIYGESLYELARDEEISGVIYDELRAVCDIFAENPQYRTLLSLPSVPKAERCSLLDESLCGKVNIYLLNFLKILVENGTIGMLSDCREAYSARYRVDNGIASVSAVTAVSLSDELKTRLQSKLQSVTGKKIELSVTVDPGVLGGIRIDMDGMQLDGTVRTRLDEIRKRLAAAVL